MRSIFTSVVIFLIVFNNNDCLSQLQEFNQQRYRMDKRLMLVLGSWASSNIFGSGIGWAVSTNESTKYFHQMNVMWNAVNLGLSIPGYIKARRGNNRLSFFETLNEQRKTETIFLVNAGLDIAYISSGILLKNRSTEDPAERARLAGFGNSIILQGGFLLIFDWVAFSLHRGHSKNELNPLLQRIQPSLSGIGLRLILDSKLRKYSHTI